MIDSPEAAVRAVQYTTHFGAIANSGIQIMSVRCCRGGSTSLLPLFLQSVHPLGLFFFVLSSSHRTISIYRKRESYYEIRITRLSPLPPRSCWHIPIKTYVLLIFGKPISKFSSTVKWLNTRRPWGTNAMPKFTTS